MGLCVAVAVVVAAVVVSISLFGYAFCPLVEQKRSGERLFVAGAPPGGGAVVEERVHARPLWFWPP